MSNKDEARRARDLAEASMRKSDYAAARRIALRAQKLDANLENIDQMILVCDVHCAALEKSGGDTDWYKILQVTLDADDNAIKKQYRRLALSLHPDKNKLPGAEAAFKTIGEAQRTLLNRGRILEMKRKPFERPAPASQPQQAPPRSFYTPPNFNPARNSFTTGFRPEQQQKPQPTGFSGGETFWTACAFCQKKFEYQREHINKVVTCPSCGKQYVAFEVSTPVQRTFPFFQQRTFPTQEAGNVAERQNQPEKQKQADSSAKMSSKKETYRAKRSAAVATESINGERKRKKVVESIDSSGSSSECEELTSGGQGSASTNGQHSRKPVRGKQHVSYEEKESDDNADILDNNKEEDAEQSGLRKNHLSNGIKRTEKMKKDQAGSSRKAAKDSSSERASDMEIFECADPDFTNFEKSREESCFKAGQTWAMYDDMDRMPRFYAIIRKVIRRPEFMVEYKWLEAKPDDEKAKQWVRRELPVAVGKFKLGDLENTKDTPSFSHVIHCRIGNMKGTFSVYPRRGEIWALFKNWDINWSSSRQSSSHGHKYEYEFVEILSEYAEGAAIDVAFLRKVKGFASVFCRTGSSDTFRIQPRELLRFSHSIPSTKLTGNEGNGVPAGSYELDTAALPPKMEEGEAVPGEAAKSTQVNNRPSASKTDCKVIPNYQFHDFSAERLEGKFASGQIWSLNSKEDGLPKCYAKILKIVWRPAFVMQIKRLELQSLPADVKQWRDKNMPVSCGNFMVEKGPAEALTEVTGFSHEIKAQPQDLRKSEYSILPKTGEFWAMYKNWSETIKVPSLKKCEYEAVEVLDDNESHIEVMVLERVVGYVSVFKEKKKDGMDVKMKIPRSALLRFSHFVPAFHLTEERNGDLRGCVELDPTALPRNLRRG